jgi:hypothetical protein
MGFNGIQWDLMGFKERNGMIFGLQATKCWDIITDKHG